MAAGRNAAASRRGECSKGSARAVRAVGVVSAVRPWGPSGQEDVMTTIATAEMTTGSVLSKDGTRIGYLQVGQGPAAVLVHGSNESARSHTRLALALADAFTVYLPDRRGRG